MTALAIVESNAEARADLAAVAASLTADHFRADCGGGWMVSSVFAHLAFWDRQRAALWRAALAAGLRCPPPPPDGADDVTNEGLEAVIHDVPGPRAVALWRTAAEALDALIAGLPDASAAAAAEAGLGRLVDRSLHRREHLEQIERALAGPPG
jgi:hypothetical protein